MPTLEIKMNVIGQLNNENDVMQNINMPMSRNNWIKIHQNEVCKKIH